MYNIDLIQHTADKGIRVQANSLEYLFQGALVGMAQIQKKDAASRPGSHKFEMDIEAPDRTALLIDFLSEIHTHSDIYNIICNHAAFQSLTETHLRAVISGTKVSGFDEDIKAVTHSQADIHKTEEGLLETIIVFDM